MAEYNICVTDRSTESRREGFDEPGFFASMPVFLVYNYTEDARSLFDETGVSDPQVTSV